MDDKNKSEPNIQAFEPTKDFIIPDWHVELVKKELENISNGNAGLLPWS